MAETEAEPLLADKSIAFPIMCDPTAVIHPVSEQKRKKNKTLLAARLLKSSKLSLIL